MPKQKKTGFTWGHGNKQITRRSKLCRRYCSSNIKFLSSTVTIDFDKSDHSLLSTQVEFKTGMVRGPGLYRIDMGILDDKQIKDRIKSELREVITAIPAHFDPHLKWDYIKMQIRNIFTQEIAKKTPEIK